MKAATRNAASQLTPNAAISIHAAREGGDDRRRVRRYRAAISIHAAREGGDLFLRRSWYLCVRFQSTPPVKAATSMVIYDLVERRISIHAAREGGDAIVYLNIPSPVISIHAAREGGDWLAANGLLRTHDFNPRRP